MTVGGTSRGFVMGVVLDITLDSATPFADSGRATQHFDQ
jgi:hypothetical protein